MTQLFNKMYKVYEQLTLRLVDYYGKKIRKINIKIDKQLFDNIEDPSSKETLSWGTRIIVASI